MVDDIRRPREQAKTAEDKNKQENTEAQSQPSLEAPHLYNTEEGFVAAKASRKLRTIRWPHIMFKHATKKERVLGSALVAVIILGGATGSYALNKSFNGKGNVATPIAKKADAQPTKPSTEASRLTGVQITPELNKRPITSIQIENSPDARPQAGLKDAGVVFEAVAEGGITRFNASFLEAQPDYIGPVRSVRPYYAALAAPFDPIFVHAGGSGDGLAKLRELGLKDLDHGANGGAFRRVPDRYAPHNLYTSMADLDKASAGRGYTTSNVKSLPRKTEKQSPTVTARTIDLSISSALYNVHYDYDQATNSYKRSEGGKPHTDHRSGQQLAPKTVVALVMNYSQQGIYSVYQTNGSGKAYVFQDGTVQTGSWTKAGDKEQLVFTDDSGKPMSLNAGQTWITLVKSAGSATYAP
jgi:hypothetical protein